jgi:hypothetical protein
MESDTATLQLAGSTRHYPCHVCAFFHSREEEAQILKPFIKEGFEKGDKIFQIAASEHCDERRRQVAELGVDLDFVVMGGALHQNPFYVPTEELLRSLRGRAARQ